MIFVQSVACVSVLLFCQTTVKASMNKHFSIIHWLKEVHMNGYDKLIPPALLENKTTDVRIEIYVESIGNFRASAMDYELDMFFIEHWTDKRLKHNQSNFIIFNDKFQLDRLWTPDIYFANSKTAQFNFVMVPNMNFRIWPNGTVRLGTRVSMKVLCHMDLTSYPIDKQICKLKIISCASSQETVNVTWVSSHSPILLDPDIQPTELTIEKTETTTCEAVYYGFSYSCLIAQFHLQRSIAYSILQTYIPTSLIVMTSWISFWVDPESVPGRVGLGITTLLTLATQAIAKHLQLPPVGYPKAQDVWFGICITFLFCALIEFAIVNMYIREAQEENAQAKIIREAFDMMAFIVQNGHNESNGVNNSSDVNGTVMPTRLDFRTTTKRAKLYYAKALSIDKCCRAVFPITFFLLCAIYWSIYIPKN